MAPDAEEGADNGEQDHIIDEDEVDVPTDAEEEDAGHRLRSGTGYNLRRLTKPLNRHRNRFKHEFSSVNVCVRSQVTCADVKPRIVQRTRWYNAKRGVRLSMVKTSRGVNSHRWLGKYSHK